MAKVDQPVEAATAQRDVAPAGADPTDAHADQGGSASSGDDRAGDARRLAEMMAASARIEANEAQTLIDRFLIDVAKAQRPATPLRARTLDGQIVKTDKCGWYLNNKHSVAIGDDGSYYLLNVPGGFMARFRGVRLVASPPSLAVGRGGPDGDGGSLKQFLERVLAGQVI
ncbi:MAG: hypothetical protein LBV30_01855 [Propionibacteriaceae bacterium]|nr:hypothetical protein [Propionibacteriaceae bacterium]